MGKNKAPAQASATNPKRAKRAVTKKAKTSPSPSPSLAPNFDLVETNGFLFRDTAAFLAFDDKKFRNRPLADCFYFDSNGRIEDPFLEKLNGWINHWDLSTFVSCRNPFTALMVRAFYANMNVIKKPELIIESYLCGKEIRLDLDTVADFIKSPNEGQKIYVYKKWPYTNHGSKLKDYKDWFSPLWDDTSVDALLATPLPALHKFLHLIINNILTPKRSTKSNIEQNGLFLLRHLIAKDDVQVNIPFIFLSHMSKAYKYENKSLPYANLISLFFKERLQVDFSKILPVTDLQYPINLLSRLVKNGWIVSKESNLLIPDTGVEVNQFILEDMAAPNQYTRIITQSHVDTNRLIKFIDQINQIDQEVARGDAMLQDQMNVDPQPNGNGDDLLALLRDIREYQVKQGEQIAEIMSNQKALSDKFARLHEEVHGLWQSATESFDEMRGCIVKLDKNSPSS